MKIAKEVKVGLLAIMAVGMFVVGYNYLRGQDIFTTTNTYKGVYKKIDGLIPSNPVLINGYEVGKVSNIEMDHSTLELTVEISVPRTIKVPANTVMRLINNDMIGAKAIELQLGDSSVLAEDGALLISEQDAGIAQAASEILSSLTQSVSNVLGNIDTAVAGADLETTLNDASVALKSFKETADKFNKMLDGKDAQMDVIFNNVESTTAALKDLGPKITSISANLDKTSEELSEVDIKAIAAKADSLMDELNAITSAINNSEGAIGKLVNDDALYVQLDSTLAQIKSLLADIEAYPSRYTGLTSRQRKRADKKRKEAQADK